MPCSDPGMLCLDVACPDCRGDPVGRPSNWPPRPLPNAHPTGSYPAGSWPDDRARHPPGTVRATRRVAPPIGRLALCSTPIPPDRPPPGRDPTIVPAPHRVRCRRPGGSPLQLAASSSAQRPSHRIVSRRVVARRSCPPPTGYDVGDPPGRPSNWPPRPLPNAHPTGSYPAGSWPDDRARPPPGTVRATRRVAPMIVRLALCSTPIPPDRPPPGRGPTIVPAPPPGTM
jgi:hypothetical protein